ncbi:MAG: sulfotransferase family protein [Anaerolineae bacterium]
MAFDFKGFFRFAARLLSRIGDHCFGWTPRRAVVYATLYLFYPPFELANWLHLALDNLLYPGYRRMEVAAPVFIAGNFRSGTTFLHRLLARDYERFCTMQMWELLFAPSILQRRLVRALGALDQWLGAPFGRRLAGVEDHWQEENPMHRVSLGAPEEDDYLLLHIWSALTIGLSSGVLEEARPYAYFDTALSERTQDRILGFYRRCLQRHLHSHSASGRHYLAKNPALTPKIDAVYRWFPDAKVILLVRSPLDVVPSFVHMMQFSYRVLGTPNRVLTVSPRTSDERTEGDALRDFVVDMARHWYTHALERLDRAPEDNYIIVRYDNLVDDPAGTVRSIYARFGFEVGPAYAEVLQAQAERARSYRSRHSYSLEGTGLTREGIVSQFRDVFDRFGFPTGEADTPAPAPAARSRGEGR